MHFYCGESEYCIFVVVVSFSDGAVHISGDSLSIEWRTKPVRQWSSHDVLCWIMSVAHDENLNAEESDISHFREIDGATLYKMSEAHFVSMESQYGKLLYNNLQRLKQEQDQQMVYDLNKREFFFCKYALCDGSLHVACSVRNGKMGFAAVVFCDVNVVGQI